MKRFQFLMVLAIVLIPISALGHPLGNFTINHHLAVSIAESRLEAEYIVDMAEIPAFKEISALDVNGEGLASESELGAYSQETCSALGLGLWFELDGKRLELEVTDGIAATLPGQNGVPTLRIECTYVAEAASGLLNIRNANFEDRIGWAEIIVSSEIPISTDLPGESASAYLSAYPDDELGETPNTRSGEVAIGTGSKVTAGQAPLVALSSAFDAENSGLVAGLVAFAAALALGAGHALAPGHGKTIVAAYLVGSRGTSRQALVLAGATAVSHTAGVAILGIIAATASVAFEPTVFYPYLSTLAGVVIVVVGGRLLWSALRRKHGHTHDHGHPHDHDSHGTHSHDEAQSHTPALGWKAVAALGFSGGLVPSASAVVLLLGAIQLGRAWFGVLLVAAFGIGMASALVGSGLLAVAAHRFGWRWFSRNRPESTLWRWVPVTAASAVVVLGLVLTISAVAGLPSL